MFESVLITIVALYMFRWFIDKQRALIAAASQPSLAATKTTRMSENSFHPDSPSRRDIYEVAFILQQRLPPELVPQILDYAEYWLRSSVKTSETREIVVEDTQQRRRSVRPPGSSWISTLPLGLADSDLEDDMDGVHLVGLHPVQKIVFTVDARDQGWSSFPEHHGRETGSWSWFEANVREAGELSYSEQLAEALAAVRAQAPAQSDEATEIVRPQPPEGGKTITHNVHAGRTSRRKEVTWRADDDQDEEIRLWVRDLKRGQIVDVTVWARYPGWANWVKYIGIDVYVAAVR